MISDHFTKPLQGILFKLFRDLIMGYKYIGDILTDIESTTKERVGNQNKVIETSNPKNTDKRIIQVQIRNIDLSRTIKVQVRNIDSNLNSSPTRQKRAKKKLISIKKSEELFLAFRNVIIYGFQEGNQISSLSERNPIY